MRSQLHRGGYLLERSVASVANRRLSSHRGLTRIGCVGGQPVSIHPQGILFAVIEESITSVANSSLFSLLWIVVSSNTRVFRQPDTSTV